MTSLIYNGLRQQIILMLSILLVAMCGIKTCEADTIGKYTINGDEKGILYGTDTVWLSLDDGKNYISAIVAGKLGEQYMLAPEHGTRDKLYLVDKLYTTEDYEKIQDKKTIWHNDDSNVITLNYQPWHNSTLGHTQSILRLIYWEQDGRMYLVMANGNDNKIRIYEIKSDFPGDPYRVIRSNEILVSGEQNKIVNLDIIDPAPFLLKSSKSYQKTLVLFLSDANHPVEKKYPWSRPFPDQIETYAFNPNTNKAKILTFADLPRKSLNQTGYAAPPLQLVIGGAVFAPDSDGHLAYFITQMNASSVKTSQRTRTGQRYKMSTDVTYEIKDYRIGVTPDRHFVLGTSLYDAARFSAEGSSDGSLRSNEHNYNNLYDLLNKFAHVYTPWLHKKYNDSDLLVMGVHLSRPQDALFKELGNAKRVHDKMPVGYMKSTPIPWVSGEFVGLYNDSSTENVLKNQLQSEGASVLAVIYGWPYFATKDQTQIERENNNDSPTQYTVPTMTISQARFSTERHGSAHNVSAMMEIGGGIDFQFNPQGLGLTKNSDKISLTGEFEANWGSGDTKERSISVNRTRNYTYSDRYYRDSPKSEGIGGYLNSGMILYTKAHGSTKSIYYLEPYNGIQHFTVEGTSEPFMYAGAFINLKPMESVDVSYFNLENPNELIMPDNFNASDVPKGNKVSPLSFGLSGRPFPLLYYRRDNPDLFEDSVDKIIAWQSQNGLDEIFNRFVYSDRADENLKAALQSIDPKSMPDGYIRYSMTESFEINFSDKKITYQDSGYKAGGKSSFQLQHQLLIAGGYIKGGTGYVNKWENRWEAGSTTGLKFSMVGASELTPRSHVLQFFIIVDVPRYKKYLRATGKQELKPLWMSDWVWENNSRYTFIFPFLPK